jgi:hypothetical protein
MRFWKDDKLEIENKTLLLQINNLKEEVEKSNEVIKNIKKI